MELTAAALWLNTVFSGFDQSVTLAIHSLYDMAGGFFTPFFEFISILGYAGIPLIIFAFMLTLFKKSRRVGLAMLIALAFGALVTNVFVKVYVARPRPYLNEFYRELWLLVGQNTEHDFCFPSGHTTAAFAFSVSGFICMKNKRKGFWILFFGPLMAVSRIYLVVHYPSDILGGIVIGSVAAVIGWYVTSKLPESVYIYELKKPKKAA